MPNNLSHLNLKSVDPDTEEEVVLALDVKDSAARGDITTIRGDITALDNRVTALENAGETVTPEIILLGDSFGSGYSVGVTNGRGWVYYAQQVFESMGYICHNTSGNIIPGVAGFASSQSFELLLEYVKDNKVQNANAVKEIYVLGGNNDVAYAAYIESAIESFMNAARSWFPNAKVYIGTLSSYPYLNETVIEPEYKKCELYGATYIRGTKGLFCDPDYIDSDNVHLTQSGYLYYSTYITDALLQKECQFRFRFERALTVDPDVSNIGFGVAAIPKVVFTITQDTVEVAFSDTQSSPAIPLRCWVDYLTNTAALLPAFVIANTPRFARVAGILYTGTVNCQKSDVWTTIREAELRMGADIVSYVYIPKFYIQLSTAYMATPSNYCQSGTAQSLTITSEPLRYTY